MPTIIPRIIIIELPLRHSIAMPLATLLTVRSHTGSGRLPSITFPGLSNTARAVARTVISERTPRRTRLLGLGVEVVQAVHAALVVLAANVEV